MNASRASIRLLVLASASLAFFVTTGIGCSSRTEGLDPTRLPENVRGDYGRFARKCSKCHGLARPLQSGITDDEQWVLYVNRMRRQPGSGISMEDQAVVLRFLRYYSAEQRRIQAEKKGLVPPATTPSATTPSASSPSPAPAPAPAPTTAPTTMVDAGAP